MPSQVALSNGRSRSDLALMSDRIVEIVDERGGVRETELAVEIINDLRDHPMYEAITTEFILAQIQQAIHTGRVIGVDCQMGERGCTFLFPAGTQIRAVMPIEDQRTRH